MFLFLYFQFGCTTAYKRRAFITSSSTCKCHSCAINAEFICLSMNFLDKLFGKNKRLIIYFEIFRCKQRNRRRTVWGHCCTWVLQRSGRIALYPTDPGERQSLPPERRRTQGSQGNYFYVNAWLFSITLKKNVNDDLITWYFHLFVIC